MRIRKILILLVLFTVILVPGVNAVEPEITATSATVIYCIVKTWTKSYTQQV